MARKITPAQRKVLDAGFAFATHPGVGLYPSRVWTLKDGTRVTATVNAMISSGLMRVERGMARVTEAGSAQA